MINETKDCSSGIPINRHQVYCIYLVDDAALLVDDDGESGLICISLVKFYPRLTPKRQMIRLLTK